MNRNEHEIDATLLETDALARRAARLDAESAAELPRRAAGVTLEDRIFAATKDVLKNSSPVVARIGPGWGGRNSLVWKIAAALVVVTGVGALVLTARPVASTQTIASTENGNKTASEVELVLAVVSLLDEPLSGNFDQLVEDTARLHELVATDRTFAPESSDERSTKQGV